MPTATGTNTARAIHKARMTPAGTEPESGMNATTNRASFGAAMPRRSTGQRAAAATNPDSNSLRRPSTRPKSAITAQSNSAEKILPTERVSRLMMP